MSYKHQGQHKTGNAKQKTKKQIWHIAVRPYKNDKVSLSFNSASRQKLYLNVKNNIRSDQMR